MNTKIKKEHEIGILKEFRGHIDTSYQIVMKHFKENLDNSLGHSNYLVKAPSS
jgi:hypothetical protein